MTALPPRPPALLWSAVLRDEVILAEAGEDVYGDGAVAHTAQELLRKRPTPGYEFHTGSRVVGAGSSPPADDRSSSQNSTARRWPWLQAGNKYRLRGTKFHLYEQLTDDEDDDEQDETLFVNQFVATTSRSSVTPFTRRTNANQNNHNNNNMKKKSPLRIWVFAAVYDPTQCEEIQVQSFLEKMVMLTEMWRLEDPDWWYGTTLACQATFAPILWQQMQEVAHHGKMAMLEQQLEMSKDLMHRNIELILNRQESIDQLHQQATVLQDMATSFKKRARTVRQMKMMQNAKHGLLLGTAITAGVAIVVIPPLVAIL